jgi:predicted unusual protein kinase regulating ubiquinone biosynthesis (AarF/ABC1/UbiB family)
VGQTFLAKAVDDKGKDVEVVVKLLRPGIVERAARERRFMESVAQGIPGMEATFAGIADQIEGELDLRNEAANVRKGDIYNHIGSEDVRAMKLMESVPESSTYMVIERAPGSPMSKYIKLCADPKVKLGFDPVVMGPRMAQQLYDLSSKWFEEAMFGSGFYHGDLHAGNIMFDGDANENGLLTAIDFGNAKTLSQEERSAIFKLMVAIEIKDSNILLQHFRTLLSPQSQAKLTPELEARFTAEADKLLRGPKAATGGDAMVKVLTMANDLGLEMPGAISNFSRSQVMLENALSEIVGHNTRNWRTAADDKADAPEFIKRNTVTFHASIDRQASKLESTGKSEDRAVAYALRACKMVEFADLNQTQRDLLTQYVPNDYKAVSHFHAKLHRQVSDDPPPVLTMGDAIMDVLSRHKWDAAKLAGLGNSLVALVKSRFTPDEAATTLEQPQAQNPVTQDQLV